MSAIEHEIASQPDTWRRAAELAGSAPLPPHGQRLMVIGCGTSYHIARAYAALREAAAGETDAFAASELPAGRAYPSVLAISRSGTTTEVLRALSAIDGGPAMVITAVAGSPVVDAASRAVVMEFADERSVVPTRFATSALALLRAPTGHDLAPVITAWGSRLRAP